MSFLRTFIAFLTLFTAPLHGADAPLNILVIGDSALAANMNTERSVGDYLRTQLGATVTNRPVAGAAITYPLPITGAMGLDIDKQYRDGDWDWIVVNGGGNDLMLGCGCGRCDRMMNRLITENGRGGAIPRLAAQLYQTGARVIWVGYLHSPGLGSPIESCKNEGLEMGKRLGTFTKLIPGIDYLSMKDLVKPGVDTFLSHDRVHPSPKGSEAIAKRISKFIRTARPVKRVELVSGATN